MHLPNDFMPGISMALKADRVSGLAEISNSGRLGKEMVADLANGGVADRSRRMLSCRSQRSLRRVADGKRTVPLMPSMSI